MAAIGALNGGSTGPVPNDGVNIGVIKSKLEDPNATSDQKKEYLSFVLASMKEDPNPGSFKKSLIDQFSKLIDGTIEDADREALAKNLNISVDNLPV